MIYRAHPKANYLSTDLRLSQYQYLSEACFLRNCCGRISELSGKSVDFLWIIFKSEPNWEEFQISYHR